MRLLKFLSFCVVLGSLGTSGLAAQVEERCGATTDPLIGRWYQKEDSTYFVFSEQRRLAFPGGHLAYTLSREVGRPYFLTARPLGGRDTVYIDLLTAVELQLRLGQDTLALVRVPDEYVDEIALVGPAHFRGALFGALAVLRTYAPDQYEVVQEHVRTILYRCPTGTPAKAATPMIYISEQAVRQHPAVLASILLHEAVHLVQKRRNPESPLCTVENEQEAIAIQYAFLSSIRPDDPYTQVLRKADGTHVDLDGDGDCDSIDTSQRTF
ncbi:MAG: hypothetical protein AAGG50_06245 [Bacteroidota bacterium]